MNKSENLTSPLSQKENERIKQARQEISKVISPLKSSLPGNLSVDKVIRTIDGIAVSRTDIKYVVDEGSLVQTEEQYGEVLFPAGAAKRLIKPLPPGELVTYKHRILAAVESWVQNRSEEYRFEELMAFKVPLSAEDLGSLKK